MLFAHDVEQVMRWTEPQKANALSWLKCGRFVDFTDSEFRYTDVPWEGGPVIMTAPSGEQRTFYEDGSVATDWSGVH